MKSDRIQTVTHKHDAATVAVAARSVDGLGRLTSISTTRGAATARSFGYGYNSANQRDGVTWEDGSKWAFGYDTLGQVTSGVRKWGDQSLVAGQQFGYEFDSIGNRKTATRNGRTATYTPDTLNQYDQQTVPGFVDLMGEATAAATVTVNNQPTARKGTYFHKEVEAINTAAPVLAELKTVAVKSNADAQARDAVLSATKYAFVPQTPEIFVHDDDGNLTEDGQFTYTWDGENRLIKVETKPAAVAVGAKKVKQEAEFDHRNLRVRLKLSEWTAGAWTVTSDLIESAYHEAHTFHPGKRVARLDLDRTNPTTITGDTKALRHAFSELMLNALQANPDNPTITVRIHQDPGLTIEVQDAGPGFPSDIADQIGVPFQSTRSVGLGLGLTVTRKIIENHLGTLEIPPTGAKGPGIVRVTIPPQAS